MLAALAAFDPHIAGTPPLGLDLPTSDIDILCHAPDSAAFAATVSARLGHQSGFALRTRADGAQVVRFIAAGWPFEVFASAIPVIDQPGWRHFRIERRLLRLGGTRLRAAVMARRHRGMKTEPAFADLLGLPGNPYEALLTLEAMTDAVLGACVRHALNRTTT